MYFSINFTYGIGLTGSLSKALAIIRDRGGIECRCFPSKVDAYLNACSLHARKHLDWLPLEDWPVCPMPALESFDVAEIFDAVSLPFVCLPTQRYFGVLSQEATGIPTSIDQLGGVLKNNSGSPFWIREFATPQEAQRWIKTECLHPLISLGAYIPQTVRVSIPEVAETISPYASNFGREDIRHLVDELKAREEAPMAHNDGQQRLMQMPPYRCFGANA